MRIRKAVAHGLDDEGRTGHMGTSEKRVKAFHAGLIGRPNHSQDRATQKMVAQLDQHWENLFATCLCRAR